MKPYIVFIAFFIFWGVSHAFTAQQEKNNSFVVDSVYLEKQKFLFEIVYRLNNPLLFEEYIELGRRLITEKDKYEKFDEDMLLFNKAFDLNILLPKGEFFGALFKPHMTQCFHLFKYFYFAKTFETFKANVCWARRNINEGLFFNALQLAVKHRKDLKPLILPSIHEIFPEHFFNSKVISKAGKFNYNLWQNNLMIKTKFKDIDHEKKVQPGVWQWWKLNGLEEQFYEEKEFIHRENFDKAEMTKTLQELKVFWIPAGYTKDIEIYNSHSKISYFTEDVGLNEFWYQLNLENPRFLEENSSNVANGTTEYNWGTYWIFNVQQILARYSIECLSNGYKPKKLSKFITGYKSYLVSSNGLGFNPRLNSWENQPEEFSLTLEWMLKFFGKFISYIDRGFFVTENGIEIDLRKPESIENIGRLLQLNINVYEYTKFHILVHGLFSDIDENSMFVDPNVLLNHETSLRDPIFFLIYENILNVINRFMAYLEPYSQQDLLFEGVQIEKVKVDKLVTFFDFVDFDITNLLNEEIVLVDGKHKQDKILTARQMRLNHKPFHLNFTIKSNISFKVIIRSFLAPKYDNFGRFIPLKRNRKNFLILDEFSFNLKAGYNTINRSSDNFYLTTKDQMTYSEMYRNVLYALKSNNSSVDELIDHESHSKFPNRLLLPKGWVHGMPIQMFFMVFPYTEEHSPFTLYPFDRAIDEWNFFVPNMFVKESKIFHEDNTE